MKLSRKPELSIFSSRESLYVINVDFGYEKKIIRPEGPAKKIILLRFCPKKIFWPGPKTQAPLPLEYQMDRALIKTELTSCGESL